MEKTISDQQIMLLGKLVARLSEASLQIANRLKEMEQRLIVLEQK